LGEAEFLINNSTTAATKLSPNEVLFGFKLRSNISVLGQGLAVHDSTISAPVLHALARADAEDASKHAAYYIAKYYNLKHKDVSFKVGDKIYVRLGKGYKLRGVPKAKLGFQRVGPFPVLAKVRSLAYKLQLPEGWRIHPVISVAQLEPAVTDPFDRTVSPPPPVEVDGEEQWEIEAIVRSEVRGHVRNRRTHYLVRWKGYGPEVDCGSRWREWSTRKNCLMSLRPEKGIG
jgi:hypothetical protein